MLLTCDGKKNAINRLKTELNHKKLYLFCTFASL